MDALCSRCETAPRAAGGGYCKACRAAYMREWRKTHKLDRAAQERGNARSYVNSLVARGVIKREPCEECGEPQTLAFHLNYKVRLKVRWLCAKHHAIACRHRRDAEARERKHRQGEAMRIIAGGKDGYETLD